MIQKLQNSNLLYWYRSLGSLLYALIFFALYLWLKWWVLLIVVPIAIYMAWWVSPIRKGQSEAFSKAIAEGEKVTVIWAPSSKLSSKLMVGSLPHKNLAFVNFFFDADAVHFAKAQLDSEPSKSAAYKLLPIAIYQNEVITRATPGELQDKWGLGN